MGINEKEMTFCHLLFYFRFRHLTYGVYACVSKNENFCSKFSCPQQGGRSPLALDVRGVRLRGENGDFSSAVGGDRMGVDFLGSKYYNTR